MTLRTLPRAGEKRKNKMKYRTLTGLMAAMITLMTAYICHIPIGLNGGYLHFGDSLIYLAAALLPTPYALAAAAIGGAHRLPVRQPAPIRRQRCIFYHFWACARQNPY